MNGILALILVLFVLLLAVEGKHAVTTFTSLALNALLLIVTIILIAGGFQPIGVALVLGVLGLSITIFMNSQNTKIAGPAFLASMLVLLGLAGLMWVLVTYGVTGGFGDEDGETLEGFSLLIGVSFKQIMIATGIMSALGAVAEVAIAVAAGLTTADLDTPQAQHELTSEIIGTA